MHDPGSATAAYDYPLLIKHLLHTPLFCAPDQEIVSGSGERYSYRTFRKRIGRLARGLTTLGVRAGDTVAVMDWDSHRYLESFFAVPMMGATLHTINVRLSPEQILYTINHAGDDIILAHADFAQLLDQIADRFKRPVAIVLLQDGPAVRAISLPSLPWRRPGMLPSMRRCWRHPTVTSSSRISTSGGRRRPSTRRARPGIQRASPIAIVRSFSTRSAC